jgi:hypothetical protein
MIPCGHIDELPIEDRLWRRFSSSPNHRTWDDDLGRWLPNLGDLQFNPELSTYWRQHLRMHGKGPLSLLDASAAYDLVGELTIGEIQMQGFPVRQSPDDEDSSKGCAHVSVYWPPGSIPQGQHQPTKDQRKLLRTQLARELVWVHGDMPKTGPLGA